MTKIKNLNTQRGSLISQPVDFLAWFASFWNQTSCINALSFYDWTIVSISPFYFLIFVPRAQIWIFESNCWLKLTHPHTTHTKQVSMVWRNRNSWWNKEKNDPLIKEPKCHFTQWSNKNSKSTFIMFDSRTILELVVIFWVKLKIFVGWRTYLYPQSPSDEFSPKRFVSENRRHNRNHCRTCSAKLSLSTECTMKSGWPYW